jgi:DNA-binding NarL/FixJ family response regulator
MYAQAGTWGFRLNRSLSIRIVLVDDERMMRDGLRALFDQESNVEVVGEGNEGLEALELVRQLRPDLVVMNIGPRVPGGMDIVRRIAQEQSDAKIIALSAFCNKALVAEAFRAGVHAYIAKRNKFDELRVAIQTVTSGSTYFCSDARESIIEGYARGETNASESTAVCLTERECEVLQLLAEGKTSKEIALDMDLSSKTIDACRRQLMRKLGVDGMAGLVKHAILMGLTTIAP